MTDRVRMRHRYLILGVAAVAVAVTAVAMNRNDPSLAQRMVEDCRGEIFAWTERRDLEWRADQKRVALRPDSTYSLTLEARLRTPGEPVRHVRADCDYAVRHDSSMERLNAYIVEVPGP